MNLIPHYLLKSIFTFFVYILDIKFQNFLKVSFRIIFFVYLWIVFIGIFLYLLFLTKNMIGLFVYSSFFIFIAV